MKWMPKKLGEIDRPDTVNKRLNKLVADSTCEKVHKNLKEKKVIY